MDKRNSLHIIFLIICMFFSNILSSQNIVEMLKKAEEYRLKGDFNSEVQMLNKVAYMQWEVEDFLGASESFSRMLEINKSSNNKQATITLIYNLGAVYHDAQKYTKAYDIYMEGVDICTKLNRKTDVVSNYTNAATALQSDEKYLESNEVVHKALPFAKELNNFKMLRTCYRILAENHEKLGNTDKTIENFDLFNTYDRKIKKTQMDQVKEESEVKVNKAHAEKRAKEIELKYTTDTLKEVKEISELQKIQIDKLNLQKKVDELQKKELENKLEFRRIVTQIMTIGLVIVLLLLVVISFQFVQKKKANELLASKNEKINLQNKQITDSISYAQTIQEAILPIRDNINIAFESLIIFKPKDIVSGDFYWFTTLETGKKWMVAVVDCTGHGVPGAFMSMIGNTLLNSIVNERGVYKPSEVLTLLNEETVHSLKQEKTENRDGMDVCLCYIEQINSNTKKITYSGAKRPLMYYSNEKGEIDELKADRISIGGIKKNVSEVKFTDTELLLNKGDLIYMSTDGFIDQNAPDRKRFGSSRLKEILNEVVKEPVIEQRNRLVTELERYKAGEVQRDDITFIGLKI